MRVQQYALWLMPTGHVYDQLADLIRQLSAENVTPAFEPHVTLLSPIIGGHDEVLQKTALLCTQINALEICLLDCGYSNEYFKCLFVNANRSDQLLSSHTAALNVFGIRQATAFDPHLSIAYGDIPVAQKAIIAVSITDKVRVAFEVAHVDLYSITGNPDQWYRIERYPLGPRGTLHHRSRSTQDIGE
jgi:2'-5' RNA ligase